MPGRYFVSCFSAPSCLDRNLGPCWSPSEGPSLDFQMFIYAPSTLYLRPTYARKRLAKLENLAGRNFTKLGPVNTLSQKSIYAPIYASSTLHLRLSTPRPTTNPSTPLSTLDLRFIYAYLRPGPPPTHLRPYLRLIYAYLRPEISQFWCGPGIIATLIPETSQGVLKSVIYIYIFIIIIDNHCFMYIIYTYTIVCIIICYF